MLATLTPAGRALVEAAAPRHVEEARRAFFDAIPPGQVDELAAILRPVAAKLMERDGRCPPTVPR